MPHHFGDDEDVDAIYPDEDSGNDQTDPESNPLMVSLDDNEPTEEEISAKWFSQDAFDDDNEQKHIKMDLSEDKEDEEEDEMHMDKKGATIGTPAPQKSTKRVQKILFVPPFYSAT
ncbi:hypothetical protein Tco_1542430 [Tanacetum coccineum]